MPVMQLYEINVFLASPSDTFEQRAVVKEVVDNLNATFQRSKFPVRFNLLAWEALPTGGHPESTQHFIYEHYPPKTWDVFIAIFKKKFGEQMPSLSGQTKTEHEVRQAVQLWKSARRPVIHPYFSKDNSPADTEEAAQYQRVKDFQKEIEQHFKTLWFTTDAELKFQVSTDLFSDAHDFVNRHRNVSGPPEEMECIVHASPVHMRGEGVTEQVGPITLRFVRNSGTDSNQSSQLYDITVFVSPSINITNATYGTEGSELGITDAVLTIDGSRSKYHLGCRAAANAVSFKQVEIKRDKNRAITLAQIFNLRVNCSQIGVPFGEAATVSIVVYITHSDVGASGIKVEHQAPTVGFVRPSLRVTVEHGMQAAGPSPSDLVFRRKEGIYGEHPVLSILAGNITQNLAVNVCALAHEVFKTASMEAQLGQRVPVGPAVTATRVIARFNNVPAGVKIFASNRTVNGGGGVNAAIVTGADPNGRGGVVVGYPNYSYAELTIAGGSATAVWEWLGAISTQSNSAKQFWIPLIIRAEPGKAESGTALVSVTLAPVSTVATGSSSAPVPRFVDTAANRVLFRCE